MSVQFGRWNFDGRPADREYLAKAEGMLAPYGPDGGGAYIKDSVGILFRAFHTTDESRNEAQPYVSPSGAVLTWDGRLDNRAELIRDLKEILTSASTDLSIVAAAYERWGTSCFAKLIGDWALSIWNPGDRSVILAKDPIGTRHLYYSFDQDQVSWSTTLDPLVTLAGKTFALEEEYIAGWLSFFPATHLTPYVGIHSVPPSSSVRLRVAKHEVSKYWNFDPGKRIRYSTDSEYEDHFCIVFGESVRRRLRSNCPILAELSGGMDSSSIVCMADTILAQSAAETRRLDTLSYYDDSEPNWNERPYFTKIEEKRGRPGRHIDVSKQGSLKIEPDNDRFAATPGSLGSSSEASRQFAACMASEGYRVVLSGVGGDEVTGGVPTPAPEIADLLTCGEFRRLASQLKMWAINKRKPWFHLLLEAARKFSPAVLAPVPEHKRPAPWLNADFVKRNHPALGGYETRLKFFGPLPTFQENTSTLQVLRRQLGCSVLSFEPPHERRYPYLDRDLLEFAYAIPREQHVRPGQRRSLMRRALAGIVPEEVLNRKRKAYVARAPLAAISAEWPVLFELTHGMVSRLLGIVDPQRLRNSLENVRLGQAAPVIPLLRTVSMEAWLRNLRGHRILAGVDDDRIHAGTKVAPSVISAEKT